MNHILVFGKNGFLGKKFCASLLKQDVRFSSYSSKDINLLDEDSSKALKLIPKNNYEIIFFSALTPDKGKDEITLIKNLTMIKNFFLFFPKEYIEHFIYISSDAVYSLNNEIITDISIPNPQDLYGLMHLSREKIIETHLPKTKFSILRLTGVYGFGDTHNSYGPNRFIQSALKDRKIQIFGSGNDVRSHIYIDDVIDTFNIVLKEKIFGTYCLSSEKSHSFIEIANLIKNYYKKKGIIVEIILNQNNNKITKKFFKDLFMFEKNINLKKDTLENNLFKFNISDH
jgi:nucleoside-diphosphate-sugar epimerase